MRCHSPLGSKYAAVDSLVWVLQDVNHIDLMEDTLLERKLGGGRYKRGPDNTRQEVWEEP